MASKIRLNASSLSHRRHGGALRLHPESTTSYNLNTNRSGLQRMFTVFSVMSFKCLPVIQLVPLVSVEDVMGNQNQAEI
ncbi:transmembrane protein 151B [Tachysurus ichikawai]